MQGATLHLNGLSVSSYKGIERLLTMNARFTYYMDSQMFLEPISSLERFVAVWHIANEWLWWYDHRLQMGSQFRKGMIHLVAAPAFLLRRH